MKQPGRVGAILSSDEDGTVHFLGFGNYVGDEVPPDEGGSSMTGMLNEMSWTNPKIVLDNGDVVWGCECWWGPEEQVKKQLAAAPKVQEVRIADARVRRGTDGMQ
jgi:hypothetical protein